MWVKVDSDLHNLDIVHSIELWPIYGLGAGTAPTGAEVRSVMIEPSDYKTLFAGTEEECKKYLRYLERAMVDGIKVFDYEHARLQSHKGKRAITFVPDEDNDESVRCDGGRLG